jgi:S1-C subfamily serine protease
VRFKAVWVAILAAAISITMGATASSQDVGSSMLRNYSDRIVKLTPTGRADTGGTGFQYVAPSGRAYLISNAHVCKLGEASGQMRAWNNKGRGILVRILEIADTTDLCILEPLPGVEPFSPAAGIDPFAPLYVLGHPHLGPLTFAQGYYRERTLIEIWEHDNPEKCEGPGREIKKVNGMFGPMEVCIRSLIGIDTSAVIYPGNSGSPMLNASGEVIGVVFASYGESHYGSAIPLDILLDFVSVY